MSSRLLRVAALCLAALRPAAASTVCANDAVAAPKRTPVLLQTKVKNFPEQDKGNVLYMVKSYKGFYETKLRALLQTWGSTLSKSSLLVLGDADWPDFPIAKASMCESDATEGLSCRVAYGFTVAAKHPGNWSWLVVVDDDHYIRPKLIEESLAQYDASKPVGAGCYGCGTPQYCDGHGGFCGGCGYAFSRPAVMKMVGKDASEFQAFHEKISKSKKSEGREDMAISCAMRERVPELEIQNFGVGDDPEEIEKIKKGDASLGWHHVSPEQMEKLHGVFKGAA